MASVSKNIKRLRTEKGMTQEALAQQLHVTRQAISGWENNRTQPDLDMLGALAEILGADIEELIYGKKRSVGLEPDGSERRHLVAVVLAVFGSLFAAAGAVILFIWLWNDIARLFQTVLVFLPAAAGGAAGLYAVFDKKPSAGKSEGAAVLWTVGTAVTNALVNSMYSIGMNFMELFAADLLLVMPVMFLLRSAAAYTAYTAASAVFIAVTDTAPELFRTAGALFFIPSVIFLIKSDFPLPVKKYMKWLAAAAFTASAFFIAEGLTDGSCVPFKLLFACFICLLAVDRETPEACKFRYTGAAGAIVLMFFGFFGVFKCYNHTRRDLSAAEITVLVFSALLIAAGVLYGRKSYSGNIHKTVFTASVCGAFAAAVFYEAERFPGSYILAALIAVCGVTIILRGINTVKLLPVNFGILTVIADLFCVLYEITDINIPLIGTLCLLTGVLLLLMDRKILKTGKAVTKESEAKNDA